MQVSYLYKIVLVSFVVAVVVFVVVVVVVVVVGFLVGIGGGCSLVVVCVYQRRL